MGNLAKVRRWGLTVGVAAAAVAGFIYLRNHDPDHQARERWKHALEVARTGSAEDGLRALDEVLEKDTRSVEPAEAERGGAEVVRLSASFVKEPFTPDRLDQGVRVVRRYQALPPAARFGAARAEMIGTLERWIGQLGNAAEPKLALLTAEYEVGTNDSAKRSQLRDQLIDARLALAAAKADWPLEALAILVEPVTDADRSKLVAAADKLVAQLMASPSLLVDASADFDAWLAITAQATRGPVKDKRDQAAAAKADVEIEGITNAQLAELQARRPWDQYAALALARGEASAGKLPEAIARLTKLGTPGYMIRDARLALAQLLAATGKLAEADALLDSLLGAELQRFTAAAANVEEVGRHEQDRLRAILDSGTVPGELERKYAAAHTDAERNEIIRTWFGDQLEHSAVLSDARAQVSARAHVVPAALAAGSIKLRRAQGSPEPERSKLLADAERTYLAIRVAAEGAPSYELGLGEIYARLGKTAESDAALQKVLDKHDAKLSIGVAEVYRQIGSVARAKQIAAQVYDTSKSPERESVAHLLAVMATDDEDEAERWLRKSDQNDLAIKASLLEVEGQRLLRQGKTAECADKFMAAAKIYMGTARTGDSAGYNNAAVADQAAFNCSGELQRLHDAAEAFESAYRGAADNPIITGNLQNTLASVGMLRVIGKRIDLHVLRLDDNDAQVVLELMLDGPERPALLGELAADPSLHRARDVLAQFEILAPNNPMPYEVRFSDARRVRDAVAAAAVVERARGAKGLDTSELARNRVRYEAGELDAKRQAGLEGERPRLEANAAKKDLDPRTRAVAAFLLATNLGHSALLTGEVALVARAQELAVQAMQLWPALDLHSTVATFAIDRAGLAADSKAWRAARRSRHAFSALDQWSRDGSPLVAAIRGSAQWSEAIAAMKASARRPDVDDLRLARLSGDAAFEARAKAALDDKLVHLAFELGVLLDPSNPRTKADLAYLDQR